MKQKLLFLLVAFAFPVCTMVAQNTSDDDIIVLDSTYTEDATTLQRTYFEYNENGQETKETTITEMAGQNDMVSVSRLTYDGPDRLIKFEAFDIVDGIETPTTVQLNSDFDEDNHPATIEDITYESGIEASHAKVSITQYSKLGDCMLFYKTYVLQNGEWVLESETTGTENEKGLRETTTTIYPEGINLLTTYTYYDNNLIKSVTDSYVYNGIELQSVTINYSYEFGDYGERPVLMTMTNGWGSTISETRYWYSPLKTSSIQNIIAKSQQPTMVFDLSGKYMGNSLEGLSDGIYIMRDALGAKKIKK